ncbi:uncharacterized protein LOC110694456 [Chenopodium quinoa]|uniref:uncharacterized protein LOC110694456 n=1 Tax=Chenopodium quinoa TaxID=63459 RepID=UPI000B770A05|nr:uncharacterized protein LOC110694456 [Chenopodium quinoa]
MCNIFLTCDSKRATFKGAILFLVVLVRHGQSTWIVEGRFQGSSNFSVVTTKGEAQAETSRQMLLDDSFDVCFTRIDLAGWQRDYQGMRFQCLQSYVGPLGLAGIMSLMSRQHTIL